MTIISKSWLRKCIMLWVDSVGIILSIIFNINHIFNWIETPDPETRLYTFPKVSGALNSNPTSKLLHRLRFSRNPNLKVQKTLFFAIFGVELLCELCFFLKTRYGIWKYHFCPWKCFLTFIDIFFFLQLSFNEVEYSAVFMNTNLSKKRSSEKQKK